VKAAVEPTGFTHDYGEQYEVTETISRVETCTRKSISRVPSVTDGGISGPSFVPPTPLPSLNSLETRSPSVKQRPRIQVAASPVLKSVEPPLKSTQTPRKRANKRPKNTRQDSEDEETFSDLRSLGSCSPFVKNSPVISISSGSPKFYGISAPELADLKFKDVKEFKTKSGSPLRPISPNIKVRPDSPFLLDSPTRIGFPSHPPKQQQSSQQHAPGSSLGLDDKKLVNIYLSNPSTLQLYRERLSNLLKEHGALVMEYVNNDELPPQELKNKRIPLLEMDKAYSALPELEKRHRRLVAEKHKVAFEMCQLWQSSTDTTSHDEQLAVLIPQIQAILKDVSRLLHASGAIKDGFWYWP
jgi:bloom syndrome protein